MVKFLLLSAEEVILLVSRIKNEDRAFETRESIAKQLLLKIFSVFNELIQDGGPISGISPIGVDEKELWLIRQYVQPADKAPSGRLIGVPLLRKIHQLLIDFNTELEIEAGSVDEPSFKEIKDA